MKVLLSKVLHCIMQYTSNVRVAIAVFCAAQHATPHSTAHHLCALQHNAFRYNVRLIEPYIWFWEFWFFLSWRWYLCNVLVACFEIAYYYV